MYFLFTTDTIKLLLTYKGRFSEMGSGLFLCRRRGRGRRRNDDFVYDRQTCIPCATLIFSPVGVAHSPAAARSSNSHMCLALPYNVRGDGDFSVLDPGYAMIPILFNSSVAASKLD